MHSAPPRHPPGAPDSPRSSFAICRTVPLPSTLLRRAAAMDPCCDCEPDLSPLWARLTSRLSGMHDRSPCAAPLAGACDEGPAASRGGSTKGGAWGAGKGTCRPERA